MPHRERQAPTTKWPRHWYNYPMILAGIVMQYTWAICIAADPKVLDTTTLHSLLPYVITNNPTEVRWVLTTTLFCTATLSLVGFNWKKNFHTILSFIPQQFIMFICAGGAIQAMAYGGAFDDGIYRGSPYLIADQAAILILSIFHTWAMVLILIHGEDKEY